MSLTLNNDHEKWRCDPQLLFLYIKGQWKGVGSDEQRCHFSNCINKIYHNNGKFMYRGDKKRKLFSIYGYLIERR